MQRCYVRLNIALFGLIRNISLDRPKKYYETTNFKCLESCRLALSRLEVRFLTQHTHYASWICWKVNPPQTPVFKSIKHRRFSRDTESQKDDLAGSEPHQFNISQHNLTSSGEPRPRAAADWFKPSEASAWPHRCTGTVRKHLEPDWCKNKQGGRRESRCGWASVFVF